MIEQLRSASDQLRAAWENYQRVYSNIEHRCAQGRASEPPLVFPEIRDQLETELAFISSYESKIQEIKADIGRVRNYSSDLVLINKLPLEIITYIFRLVLAQPCYLHLLSSKRYSGYPDLLVQVCHHWRRIALSCHFLWCHIDLSPYEPCYDNLITRAVAHLARAGELPIELHIAESHEDLRREPHGYHELYDFVSRVSSRVETLEFHVTSGFPGFHRFVLGALLPNPQLALKKLIFLSEAYHDDAFVLAGASELDDTSDDTSNGTSEDLELHITQNELDRALAPITTLHLRGIFPVWSSTAYHGLVDLRLLSTSFSSHIGRPHLIAVLSSSPSLRTLYFGLAIMNATATFKSQEILPVQLNDLQTVNIFLEIDEDTFLCPSSILRLLAPGTKPLRLCFNGNYVPNATIATELERFFARSNVESFYTKYVRPPIGVLLRHAAHLERVVLFGLNSYDGEMRLSTPAWFHVDGLASLPRLKSLTVLSSCLSARDLHLLVQCCPDGTELHNCDVRREDAILAGNPVNFSAQEITDAFPTVKIKECGPRPLKGPTANWDDLDWIV